MTTVLTKAWIHDDAKVQVADPRLLLAPVDSPEPRRLFSTALTWTSPEGTRIICDSSAQIRRKGRRVRRWKPPGIYRMLQENGLDFTIGPKLTVRVQDLYPSQASASVAGSGGTYSSFSATIWLKGINSSFSSSPHSTISHEYGHVWSYYHLYLTNQGDWSSYLDARELGGDLRLDTTYAWDRDEIIAEDYRLLFGSEKAVSQRPSHLNQEIEHPYSLPDLRQFLSSEWVSL